MSCRQDLRCLMVARETLLASQCLATTSSLVTGPCTMTERSTVVANRWITADAANFITQALQLAPFKFAYIQVKTVLHSSVAPSTLYGSSKDTQTTMAYYTLFNNFNAMGKELQVSLIKFAIFSKAAMDEGFTGRCYAFSLDSVCHNCTSRGAICGAF